MILYYNSWHPVEILEQLRIKTSVINGHDRGLSMSGNPKEWGHGPFKFVFLPNRWWYTQFIECIYEPGYVDPTHKNPMFKDEQEWWSPCEVRFALHDVSRIVFMADSPGARVHPIIAMRTWKRLEQFHAQFCADLVHGKIQLVEDHNHYPPQEI